MAAKSEILELAARSDVVVSALDARGLYTSEMDASQRGGSSSKDVMTGQHSQYQRTAMNLNENIMAELASGTGGTFFHNSNDLEGGFKNLTEAPEYMYLLEFSPGSQKPDGKYHPLKVFVDKEKMKVQARGGYFESKPPRNGDH
jgi:VWFA-related protein